MRPKINIAIDGFSSCGKSTMTKQLANVLDYIYIDTGAMYRAVTLYFIQNKIDLSDGSQIDNSLKNITLNFKKLKGHLAIQLNGQFVEDDIRGMQVSSTVSEVAAIKKVRQFLFEQQREIAKQKGVVMDGRDIGTVVLPNAEVKFFITADKNIRVKRRYDELKSKGKNISMSEIQRNLEQRDYIDSHRKDSPLSKADDAILIDNTNLTKEEQLQLALSFIEKYYKKQATV